MGRRIDSTLRGRRGDSNNLTDSLRRLSFRIVFRDMDDFIFDREEELQALKQRLQKRKPFLLHGPSGVGKTLLIRSLLPQVPAALYCENSATAQVVFRSVAQALLDLRDQRVQTSCRNRDGIQAKSAVSLKGIVNGCATRRKLLDCHRPFEPAIAILRRCGSGNRQLVFHAGYCSGALQSHGRHGFPPATVFRSS